MCSESSAQEPMAMSAVEIRVLGVLMEKALTQSSGYPMSVNALVAGANQKQNRHPVVDYDEGDVEDALEELRTRKLVVQVLPGVGARVMRYRHAVVDVFSWDRRAQAVMAELMLRGRQTAGELRTRGSRMCDIPDMEAVKVILRELMESTPRYVAELAREPGRSANRFRHLLSNEDDDEGLETADASAPISAATPRRQELAARVERLEQQVAELAAAVDGLRDSRS